MDCLGNLIYFPLPRPLLPWRREILSADDAGIADETNTNDSRITNTQEGSRRTYAKIHYFASNTLTQQQSELLLLLVVPQKATSTHLPRKTWGKNAAIGKTNGSGLGKMTTTDKQSWGMWF